MRLIRFEQRSIKPLVDRMAQPYEPYWGRHSPFGSFDLLLGCIVSSLEFRSCVATIEEVHSSNSELAHYLQLVFVTFIDTKLVSSITGQMKVLSLLSVLKSSNTASSFVITTTEVDHFDYFLALRCINEY